MGLLTSLLPSTLHYTFLHRLKQFPPFALLLLLLPFTLLLPPLQLTVHENALLPAQNALLPHTTHGRKAKRSDRTEQIVILTNNQYVSDRIHRIERANIWAKDFCIVANASQLHRQKMQEKDTIAALVLDMKDGEAWSGIALQHEGHNGRLPPLDLIAAVIRICKVHNTPLRIHPPFKSAFRQASSINNGEHALFDVPAITLTTFDDPGMASLPADHILDVMELTLRSINNLLERFHAGHFFYLILDENTFIPLNILIIPLALCLVVLLLEAVRCWLLSEGPRSPLPQDIQLITKNKLVYIGTNYSTRDWPTVRLSIMIVAESFFLNPSAPFLLLKQANPLYLQLACIMWTFTLPYLVHTYSDVAKKPSSWLILKNILCALTALMLLPVGMLNWPLAMSLALIIAPVYASIRPSSLFSRSRFFFLLQGFFVLLASPITWLGIAAILGQAKPSVILDYLIRDLHMHQIWLLPLLTLVALPLNIIAWLIISL